MRVAPNVWRLPVAPFDLVNVIAFVFPHGPHIGSQARERIRSFVADAKRFAG